MADIKNCLYAWCGKRKVTPNYDVRATGNKNRQKFTCEVRVEGFNYTAMGNSTNKKDAQANAARDYVNYLVCIGEASMSGADVSIDPGGGFGFGTLPPNAPLPPHLAVKNEADVEPGPSSGPVPGGTGLGYSNFSGPQWERGAILNNYYSNREEQEAQATLESEEVDLNASLHGNWTPENAKARLNQFFQKEKNQADYKYSQVGPDHNRFEGLSRGCLLLGYSCTASMSGADVSIDPGGGCGFGTLPPNAPLPPHLAVKNEADVEPGPSSGPVPGVTGLGYSNFSGPQWERGAILNNYYSNREEQEAQATLESEEVDLNASLHGNWTPENAKARLNQFFQKEKNQADYKYSQVGPDHNSTGLC
ncbi:UNVERIFIED_CONTAM: hypothetical protein FKN15_039879 [Acipenser sinensis]